MGEEKTVRRSVAVGLGIVCIILIVGVIGAVAFYSMRIDDLTKSRDERAAYVAQLEIWLNETKEERDQVKAPKLIGEAHDEEHWMGSTQTSYLRVYGQIINVGKDTAINCRLHVVAHQYGGVITLDTYIDLGNIDGETAVLVDTKIYYTGDPLGIVSIEKQWTG